MNNFKCQVCDHPGVRIFDICDNCGWQNDSDLWHYNNPADPEHADVIPVGYDLSKFQKELWSTSNGNTPNDHYQRWVNNGKKIKYRWEV